MVTKARVLMGGNHQRYKKKREKKEELVRLKRNNILNKQKR